MSCEKHSLSESRYKWKDRSSFVKVIVVSLIFDRKKNTHIHAILRI